MELDQIGKEFGGQTLAGALTGRLRHAIVSGRFPPGSRLRLDDLRSEYGVSLSPLREALMGLGAEGLVDVEAQRGFRIPPVSENNLKEVTRLRIVMETLALREAIRCGDLAWESAIAGALHRLQKTGRAGSGESIDEWEIAHRAFHLSILSACKMPLLLNFCSVLHDHSDRYRRLFLQSHPGDRDVPGEHERIARLTMDRKAKSACELLTKHIGRTGENVRLALTARPANDAPQPTGRRIRSA
jgi:GntR family carbon starvation induced transcriptional regulator